MRPWWVLESMAAGSAGEKVADIVVQNQLSFGGA